MIEGTDLQLNDFSSLSKQIKRENKNQLKKWGIQTRSLFEWCNYLTEEVGEVAKAIAELEYRNGSYIEVRKEAIQVATLALKIAEIMKDKRKRVFT